MMDVKILSSIPGTSQLIINLRYEIHATGH